MKRLAAGMKAAIGYANRKVVVGMVALALLLVPTMAFAWNAVEEAQPGSALYGLRRAQEGLAVRLSGGPAARAVVLAGLAGERLKETEAVLTPDGGPTGDGADVSRQEDAESARDLLTDYAEEMREAQDELNEAEEVDPDDAIEYSGKLTENQEALSVLVDMIPPEVLDALRQALQVTSEAQLDNTAVLVKLIEGAPEEVASELEEAVGEAIEAQKELAEDTDNLGANDATGEILEAQIDALEALLKVAPSETHVIIKEALATLKAADDDDSGEVEVDQDEDGERGQEVKRTNGADDNRPGSDSGDDADDGSIESDSDRGDSNQGSPGEEDRDSVVPGRPQPDTDTDESEVTTPSDQTSERDEESRDHGSTSATDDTDD